MFARHNPLTETHAAPPSHPTPQTIATPAQRSMPPLKPSAPPLEISGTAHLHTATTSECQLHGQDMCLNRECIN